MRWLAFVAAIFLAACGSIPPVVRPSPRPVKVGNACLNSVETAVPCAHRIAGENHMVRRLAKNGTVSDAVPGFA